MPYVASFNFSRYVETFEVSPVFYIISNIIWYGLLGNNNEIFLIQRVKENEEKNNLLNNLLTI